MIVLSFLKILIGTEPPVILSISPSPLAPTSDGHISYTISSDVKIITDKPFVLKKLSRE